MVVNLLIMSFLVLSLTDNREPWQTGVVAWEKTPLRVRLNSASLFLRRTKKNKEPPLTWIMKSVSNRHLTSWQRLIAVLIAAMKQLIFIIPWVGLKRILDAYPWNDSIPCLPVDFPIVFRNPAFSHLRSWLRKTQHGQQYLLSLY